MVSITLLRDQRYRKQKHQCEFAMSKQDRAGLYRKRALEAETKAFTARSDEMRRAWMVVARDWTKMAEREEAAISIVPSLEACANALENA